MDPVTASILIGLAVTSIMVGIDQNNKQVKAAEDAAAEQEKMRVDQARAEIAATAQKNTTAMGAAAKRPTTGMQPSFASAALTGNQNSNTTTSNNSAGSSGTF